MALEIGGIQILNLATHIVTTVNVVTNPREGILIARTIVFMLTSHVGLSMS